LRALLAGIRPHQQSKIRGFTRPPEPTRSSGIIESPVTDGCHHAAKDRRSERPDSSYIEDQWAARSKRRETDVMIPKSIKPQTPEDVVSLIGAVAISVLAVIIVTALYLGRPGSSGNPA
jgi:hypothetical protein